jgi:hypothetical protein
MGVEEWEKEPDFVAMTTAVSAAVRQRNTRLRNV